uniref:Cytochrome c biogenesis protein CcsB n=1 Tax=Halydictyon mirabile TaxID=189652 RepID=A0A4D6WT76_9FLOR|nr:cytochrome c biogenesis protein ccs1 [Halydictyon mirabile]
MERQKFKGIIWRFSRKIGNLNFAIFLLFLIILSIMVGSIIEQDQNLTYYQTHYAIHDQYFLIIDWKLIIFLGLDHLYQTWWFLSILFIFTCSLISCTFSLQLPTLRQSRRWKFYQSLKKINSSNDSCNFEFLHNFTNSYINIIYSLLSYDFYVFHKKNDIYAYKGIIGRVAPVFVHLSIILIVLGSMISVLFGYTSQEMVPKGEFFHIKNIVHSGIYSQLTKNYIYKINNFFIDYNTDNSVKQFFSNISVVGNKGELILNKIIYVNSPLKLQGITFYQTDWNINSLRLSIGNNSNIYIQKKLKKININNKDCWLCQVFINDSKKVYIAIFSLTDRIFIFDFNGKILDSVFLRESFYINKIPVSFNDIILDTGLQIKLDPGINTVYLGFLLLMLSTIISYSSYSQVGITIITNKLNIVGSTNRAVFFFEEDIIKIYKIYIKYSSIYSVNSKKFDFLNN